MQCTLSEFTTGINILSRQGDADPLVRGLSYDSRGVSDGFMFFAWPGIHMNGHRFITDAVKNGAKVVVHSEPVASYSPDVVYLRVEDARKAMGAFAAGFYGNPSDSLTVIGVTGTEGKSTTVSLIYQLLKLSGRKAGFISTVRYDLGQGEFENPEHQTTPESIVIQKHLASMRDSGVEFAVVETSSHGLSRELNRLGDVAFDAGVMMNVTHEHLEFHGTWERYRDDKANLFRLTGASGKKNGIRPFCVANFDDPSFDYFRMAAKVPVSGVSTKGGKTDFSVCDIVPDASGNDFVVTAGGSTFKAPIELPGSFNVANAVTALAAVSELVGKDPSGLAGLLPRLVPVRGRMTPVKRGQPFEVLVDYAHTPSSFETIFPPIRKRIRGKVISLFGSGGERDTKKRPEQGRIASASSDIVILTDEDPRGEDSPTILEDIASGCGTLARDKSLFLIPDRRKAIRFAFSLASSGDIVLLLGKGHENSIIGKNGPERFDELDEAAEALREMGYEA